MLIVIQKLIPGQIYQFNEMIIVIKINQFIYKQKQNHVLTHGYQQIIKLENVLLK